MRKIRITENQGFNIHIEKKIDRESFFFHEYEMAVEHLNHIWDIQAIAGKQKDLFIEDPNNIIAFCGERGSGKSSVMLSFINALQHSGKKDDELKFSDSVRDNNWDAKVIIDPSVFDGVHNIVDIVLAHIFQSFYDAYQEDNQRFDQYERERLYKLMAKTYKNLSIIKNKEKMLDDEYDEAGNIAKLQKLGESTQLRKTFSELIKVYLEMISKVKCRQGQKCEKLLIAIDDLDLCNEYAYDMAEQIRKYLLLPNVIIFMAIKIDQLKLGIEEKNRKDFKHVLARNSGSEELEYEILDMSQKYLTKLIPTARRISLPDLNNIEFCLAIDDDNYMNGRDAEEVILKMIRKTTGMIFETTENTYHYFVPDNLREFVNFIIFLRGLKNDENEEEIYVQNMCDFERYFINEILKTQIKKERFSDLKEVLECDSNTKNYNMWLYLNKLLLDHLKNNNTILGSNYEYPKTSFAAVLDMLNNMAEYLTKKEDYQLIYYLKVYYTIILNQEFWKNKGDFPYELTGGFIWGNKIVTVMQASQLNNGAYLYRGRFELDIQKCWKVICENLPQAKILLSNDKRIDAFSLSKNNQLYAKSIDENKKWRMASAWILMAMTVSTVNYGSDGKTYVFDGKYIYDNHSVFSIIVSSSIENYFVALSSMKKTVEKANLQLLGLSQEDIDKITQKLIAKNKKQIEIAQMIVLNPDLSTRLLNYCYEKRDYKESEKGLRTYQLYKRFLKNIENFLNQEQLEVVDISTLWVPIEESLEKPGELSGEKIDICKIYADMYETQKESFDLQDSNTLEMQRMKQDFSAKVSFISQNEYVGKIKEIPGTLRNKKAVWVKEKLEDMANIIQDYTYKNKVFPMGYDSNVLTKLYSDVVNLYMQDPNTVISDDQYNAYRKVAQVVSQIFLYSKKGK